MRARLPRMRLTDTSSAFAVKKFADEVVAPRVEEMDENEKMDPAIIKGLFEQGVRLAAWSLRLRDALTTRECS